MNKTNRRTFLGKTLALGSAAALPLSTFANDEEIDSSQPALPSLKGRKVLFTYGGWDGHEPEKYADYMSSWLKEEGAEVQLSKTLDPYADKATMNAIDLVIQVFTMSQITKE